MSSKIKNEARNDKQVIAAFNLFYIYMSKHIKYHNSYIFNGMQKLKEQPTVH
jgi:hypothetical protein